MDIKLVVGKTYLIKHMRKGEFCAQLIDINPTEAGDSDAQLLRVKIDTRKGRGQERLARAPADVTVTDLRPSLITHMELVEDDAWLIDKKVPEAKSREERERELYEKELAKQADRIANLTIEKLAASKKPSFFDRLLRRKH